jgi:acid phosphatase family membrane protein YuiD
MIVIYDAAGIRRQAGLHAELINLLIRDLREGYPLRHRKELSEVLGHSPLEAMVGVLLGIAVAQIVFLRWPG